MDAKKLRAELGLTKPAAGQAHVAGPGPDGGWRVIEVWDSVEEASAFLWETSCDTGAAGSRTPPTRRDRTQPGAVRRRPRSRRRVMPLSSPADARSEHRVEDLSPQRHLRGPLGRLKGNQGDQNYDLPADTDLEGVPTVVIRCDRFNAAFGAADLTLT
jgi:hypothetical protein